MKKVESLESDNENFKKVFENKDFAVLAKETKINNLENDIEKLVAEIKKLKQDNSKKEKELNEANKEKEFRFKIEG